MGPHVPGTMPQSLAVVTAGLEGAVVRIFRAVGCFAIGPGKNDHLRILESLLHVGTSFPRLSKGFAFDSLHILFIIRQSPKRYKAFL